jgi:acyl-CoA thioester hydrolase
MFCGLQDTFKVHVYLEDTDAYGVVYHSNYLKYLERARTSFLQNQGAGLSHYMEKGIIFVVSKLEIKFLQSAKLEEDLVIHSKVIKEKLSLIRFQQAIENSQGERITIAVVDVMSLDKNTNKLKRI